MEKKKKLEVQRGLSKVYAKILSLQIIALNDRLADLSDVFAFEILDESVVQLKEIMDIIMSLD